MSNPFDRLNQMGGEVQKQVDAIFDDIDPKVSPHAYSVKQAAQGRALIGLIDGLVHAVAAVEKDLASRD